MASNTELSRRFQVVEQRRYEARQEAIQEARQQARQQARQVSDTVNRRLDFNFRPDMLDSYYVVGTRVPGMLREIHGDTEESQSSQLP